jgi:hypothetical protein
LSPLMEEEPTLTTIRLALRMPSRAVTALLTRVVVL